MRRVSDPQRCTRVRMRCHGLTSSTMDPQALLHQEGLRRTHPLILREDLQEDMDASERSSPARLCEGRSSDESVRPPHAMRLCRHEGPGAPGGCPVIACLEGRRRAAGHWLIEPMPRRTLPAAKARRAMVSCACGAWTSHAAPLHRAAHVPVHRSTGGSPTEACRTRGSHRPDTRRRCVCCPTPSRRAAPDRRFVAAGCGHRLNDARVYGRTSARGRAGSLRHAGAGHRGHGGSIPAALPGSRAAGAAAAPVSSGSSSDTADRSRPATLAPRGGAAGRGFAVGHRRYVPDR